MPDDTSPPHDTPQPADREPTDLLLHAGRALRRLWAEAIAPWDLSLHQSRALRVVCAREQAPRLADVADVLRIAPRSATEVVDALESKGLVRRSPSPTDRRAVVVEPTPEGLRVRAAVEHARVEAAERYLSPLDAGERQTLATLLGRLVQEHHRGHDGRRGGVGRGDGRGGADHDHAHDHERHRDHERGHGAAGRPHGRRGPVPGPAGDER
ncbi:MarR family winged helix-turn-helix transcriptional regulator [Georgenia subflava]|uniref:MarR family winged helix-turn-helix transcriptional regulator n=1 Tax=Georgenia subflava TaxID=1622177 RepID=UPI001D00973F|nr:MarR family winged helix-turn-helix transcriptional regulator [Georgenia subflava]